jgi:hypothetical protein
MPVEVLFEMLCIQKHEFRTTKTSGKIILKLFCSGYSQKMPRRGTLLISLDDAPPSAPKNWSWDQ